MLRRILSSLSVRCSSVLASYSEVESSHLVFLTATGGERGGRGTESGGLFIAGLVDDAVGALADDAEDVVLLHDHF